MVNQITAEVITVGEGEPKVLSLLKNGGKATMCNTSPDLCDHYKGDANQTIVGYCRLTGPIGVACLQMARIMAKNLP